MWAMARFKEGYKNMKSFIDGYERMIKDAIINNRMELVDYVQEQLYSGLDGNEKQLTPSYLNDPFFKTPAQAIAYRNWKKKSTPPTPSYLGFQERNENTPNLIIRGDFYSSITAIPIGDGVKIITRGLSFGGDIENKYGSQIFKISSKAKDYFLRYVIGPNEIKTYYTKHGVR